VFTNSWASKSLRQSPQLSCLKIGFKNCPISLQDDKVPLRVKRHKRPSFLPMNREESNVSYFLHVTGWLAVGRLAEIPGSVIVGLLGMIVDMVMISLVALAKSPFMLLKGWKRLILDLMGQHGSCVEAACVPFAGLAIVLWPLIVCVTVLTAIICSPFLGLFSAVVVYQVGNPTHPSARVCTCCC
jgi:hypothetical protein